MKVGVDQPGLVYDIFATVRISFIGDTIVLRTDSWQGPYGMYNDLSEVKSVCFNAETKEMVIKFKNDKTEDFKAKYTNTSVTIPEAGSKPAIELTKLTSAQERAILEKINRKIPASKRQPVDAQSKQKELN